jgi:hypothetical protein
VEDGAKAALLAREEWAGRPGEESRRQHHCSKGQAATPSPARSGLARGSHGLCFRLMRGPWRTDQAARSSGSDRRVCLARHASRKSRRPAGITGGVNACSTVTAATPLRRHRGRPEGCRPRLPHRQAIPTSNPVSWPNSVPWFSSASRRNAAPRHRAGWWYAEYTVASSGRNGRPCSDGKAAKAGYVRLVRHPASRSFVACDQDVTQNVRPGGN